jgi:glycosyltransferase involved in cell wall biosynthesis
MRIAVVTTSYPTHDGDPSGHFVRAEVQQLAKHEVLVVRPKPGGAFGWPGAPTRIREKPMRGLEAAGWVARSVFELRRFAPDKVIAHWCVPSAFPIALAGPKVPLEIVSHGGDIRLLCQMPAAMRSRIIAAVFRRNARWRFVSEELRAALEEKLEPTLRRELAECSEIVPGALELPDVSEETRAKRSIVGSRRLYVCAGRLVASKRVDKVIDYVATNIPHDERQLSVLVILGDGPERAHLERLAKAWQIDVRFMGKTSRRETLGWIGAADELVHASVVEGLSTVVREASLLGVPVKILS